MKTFFVAVLLIGLAFLSLRVFRASPKTSLSDFEPLPPLPRHETTRAVTKPVNGPAAVRPSGTAAEAPPAPAAAAAANAAAGQTAAVAQAPASGAAAQLAMLEEILLSKNDNDPRLDSAFKELSLQAKRLFRQKYRQLPAEERNERGTIIYLLGRNLRSAEDWEFLHTVVNEQPCLSLADCSKETRAVPDGHLSITLAYPALVALKQAERTLNESRAAGRRDEASRQALRLIGAAKNSGQKTISDMAAELERQFRFPQR